MIFLTSKLIEILGISMDKWKSRLHTSIYFNEFTRTFLRIVSFSPIYMMFRFLIGFTQNRINLNRITNDWHTILSKWNYHFYHYLIIGMIIIENISTIFRSIEMKFLQTWRTTVFFFLIMSTQNMKRISVT